MFPTLWITSLLATRVPKPFIFMPTKNLAKRKLTSSQQGLNSQSFNHKASTQPIYNFVNSFNSKVMWSHHAFKYIT